MAVLIEQIAKICHDTNKSFCETIRDFSQPAWVDAPQWQKDSAIAGVKYHLENPDAGPEDSHNSWLKVKYAEGWIWGEVKDPENKIHPCMVPYSELPLDQKLKDYLFIAICEIFKPFV